MAENRFDIRCVLKLEQLWCATVEKKINSVALSTSQRRRVHTLSAKILLDWKKALDIDFSSFHVAVSSNNEKPDAADDHSDDADGGSSRKSSSRKGKKKKSDVLDKRLADKVEKLGATLDDIVDQVSVSRKKIPEKLRQKAIDELNRFYNLDKLDVEKASVKASSSKAGEIGLTKSQLKSVQALSAQLKEVLEYTSETIPVVAKRVSNAHKAVAQLAARGGNMQ